MLTRSLDSLVGGKPNLGKSVTGSRQSISIGGMCMHTYMTYIHIYLHMYIHVSSLQLH